MIYRGERFGSVGFGFLNPKPKPDRTRAVRFGLGSGFEFRSVISVIPELYSPLPPRTIMGRKIVVGGY